MELGDPPIISFGTAVLTSSARSSITWPERNTMSALEECANVTNPNPRERGAKFGPAPGVFAIKQSTRRPKRTKYRLSVRSVVTGLIPAECKLELIEIYQAGYVYLLLAKLETHTRRNE